MKKRKGAALLVVLLTLVFLSFAITLLFTLHMNNLQYTLTQRERIEAYYLAKSGIDLGLNAVMTERTGAPGTTILDQFISTPAMAALEDDLTHELLGLAPGAPLPDSRYNVKLAVYGVDADGNRFSNIGYSPGQEVWVEIHVQTAVPTVSNSTQRTVTYSGSMRVCASSPSMVTWQLKEPI